MVALAEVKRRKVKVVEVGDNKKVEELEKKLEEIEKSLKEETTKREEGEKEHEDLLVLLEELSQKRKRDKELMEEKGLEVSDAEDEDET